MEIVKNEPTEDVPVIYGVITDKTPEGEFMGLAIDSLDGRAIARFNGSDVAEVKFCMAFSEPGEYLADLVEFDENDDIRKQVLNIYSEAFPEGYQLEWIGLWRNDPRTVKLCAWLDGKEIPQDGFFDYATPDSMVEKNALMAAKAGFKPDPDQWKKDKSRDFYLGMASACRILAGNAMQAKDQKEILQFINSFSLSCMVIANEKKAQGPKLTL